MNQVDQKQYLERIADETLQQFEKVASAAKIMLRETHVHGADVLASVNTFTSGPAIQRLGDISHEIRESYHILAREPAIARIVVSVDTGGQRTYYICRTTKLTEIDNLVSYRSHVGRIASLPIGSDMELPGGRIVKVLERAQVRPLTLPDGWDSQNSVVEAGSYGPVTIESFRALLREIAGKEAAEDLLDQLLAEENIRAIVFEGRRRSVITKMGLRDQPILDQYQDEIFRLPLDKRLLIMGPPGTGKTTTLIRRLGQKLDTEYLEEDERRIIENISATNGLDHADSWLMFTPTELLKQYLKEAFAREGVPASDHCISTWHDYRRELGRNVFGVLRNASGGGIFVLKDSIQSLKGDAVHRSIQLFSDFYGWQRDTFVQELREAAQSLGKGPIQEAQGFGQRLGAILEKVNRDSLSSVFGPLAAEAVKVQAFVTGLKEVSDARIKSSLNLQMNRNKGFLEEFARYIDGLQQAQTTEVEDQEDIDVEDEEESSPPRTPIAAAINAYMQAVRAQARVEVSKRKLGKSSRNGKVIEWLGDRILADGERAEVGISLIVQSSARRFVNPVKLYMNGIPKRYRAFRRLRQEEGVWYTKDAFEPKDLHPLELDVVLFAILQSARDLLGKPEILRDIDAPAWVSLRPIMDLYRNQILVDEATDFSPIQLACMGALTHPQIPSYFACGDFNQRLTTWGTRSAAELKWVFPDFDIKEITVSYRQSRQLNEFARAMMYALGEREQSVSLPANVDSEGVAPVLLESASGSPVVVNWLADRIREIERFVGQLPSTAIFVNSEAEVGSVAEGLNAALEEHNIQVVACPQGQVMGLDNNVRVFDIKHIKGLEFEAVFFIAIDRLAALHPELYGKFLYVGTTRAATYLGVTCDDALPPAIETLRPKFASDWKTPGTDS